MELIVFDLDGTLLNSQSKISTYTQETLIALAERGIAYTVATGRTLHGALDVLEGHRFQLPQVFKNGVMIWDPRRDEYSHQNFLSLAEIAHVLEAILAQQITPFIFTLEANNRHAIYHPPLQTEIEERLASSMASGYDVEIQPASELPADAEITNISALGIPSAVEAVELLIEDEPHLVAYVGTSLEGDSANWIDIHHSNASKGGAIEILRAQLGASKVVCFGDSKNDISMFAVADECYAPENAKEQVKAAATKVIGHHDEDGIARFLRERFKL
jgi:Cof subfamily protein (haloacid dehalogenase superfamily)